MPKFLQRLALVYIRASIHLSVIFLELSYRKMYRKFKKVVLGLPEHVTLSIFSSRILGSEASVYKSYFFSEQPFYGNYSTLDSHTNTAISHAFAYSSRWRRKPLQGLMCSHITFHFLSFRPRGISKR